MLTDPILFLVVLVYVKVTGADAKKSCPGAAIPAARMHPIVTTERRRINEGHAKAPE